MAHSFQRPLVLTPALRVAASAALACALAAPNAAAQYSATQEFQTGFSLLRFEPAKAGDRFFGVPDANAPGNSRSRVRVLLLGDYVNAPILSRTNDQTGQTVNVISKQLIAHLEAGYFPTDQLFLNAGLPLALSQSGDSSTTPSGVAAGDARLGARYALVGSENAAISLAPALDVWVPTGSQDKLTGDGKLRAQPMLSVSGRASAFVWSADIGYQLRRHLDNGSVEIGNSYAFGAAAGVLLFNDVLQVGPELYGAALSAPARGSAFDSQNTVLEGIFGAKVHAGSFVFGAAAGPGLARAPGTAPRFLLCAAYAPQAPYAYESTATPAPPRPEVKAEPVEQVSVAAQPTPTAPPPDHEAVAETTPAQLAPGEEDTDGDGIPDNEDACKRVKGVASDIPRNNGCPPPVDTDGDGVADDNDACPKKAGVASTDPKLNGCPPPPPPRDRDGDGIPDVDDACPWKKGVASDDPKRNGCPETAARAIATSRAAVSVPATASTTTTHVSTSANGPAELTFSGFRSFDDGTSLVFVELSGPVAVDQRVQVKSHRGQSESTIVYVLENTKVPVRNNRNPLNAAEFPSVVRRATITQKKKAVELAISLKSPVQAASQIVQRGNKTVLEIRLPKAP